MPYQPWVTLKPTYLAEHRAQIPHTLLRNQLTIEPWVTSRTKVPRNNSVNYIAEL